MMITHKTGPKNGILHQIPIEKIEKGSYQPRTHFDPEELRGLADAIKSTGGLLQPLVVRPHPHKEKYYEIIAGERRWRAAQLLCFAHLPCIVQHYDDEQALEAAIIENISRTNLNPMELAYAYQRMMNEFGFRHDTIASTLGKSRPHVTNILRLLKLDPRIQDWIAEGLLSEGHGKVIASLPSSQQYTFAAQCKAKVWSVRQTEQAAQKAQQPTHLKAAYKDPNIQMLENTLSAHMGCSAHISFDTKTQKGELKLSFQSLDILDGILERMGLNTENT